MKFQLITVSMVLSIVGLSSAVEAGGRHRYYNNHYQKYERHNYKYDYGHRHRYKKNHYRRHDSHYDHYSYGHRRKHYNYNNHGHNVAYALGGLIVGGVIGATIANTFNSHNYSSTYRQPVPVNSYLGNTTAAFSSSSYILQPDGSCYVIDHVSNGKLVLSPVLTNNCQ